jgi:hypothetical protein
LAKVGLINEKTSNIVDKNYYPNLEVDRLWADLELQKRVTLSFAHDASILRTECDKLKKEVDELCSRRSLPMPVPVVPGCLPWLLSDSSLSLPPSFGIIALS